MATYAVINNNIVENVIVADSQEIAETLTGLTCIEIPFEAGAPGIGWTYNDSIFTAPPIPITSWANMEGTIPEELTVEEITEEQLINIVNNSESKNPIVIIE